MVEQAPLFRAVVADAGEAGLFDDDVRLVRYTVDHSAPRRRVSLVEEGTTQTVVGLIW